MFTLIKGDALKIFILFYVILLLLFFNSLHLSGPQFPHQEHADLNILESALS